jgi:type II secretory pathway component PulK
VNSARRQDSGYALLAVLWITVGVGALTFMISTAARDAIGTSRNRIALAQASWSAAACLAETRAVLADALSDRDNARASTAFSRRSGSRSGVHCRYGRLALDWM